MSYRSPYEQAPPPPPAQEAYGKPANAAYRDVSKTTVRALKHAVFKGGSGAAGAAGTPEDSKIGPHTILVDTDFTWSITDWYGLELSPNGDIKSPPVEIEGFRYTIAVYPRGAGTARDSHISVFLHVEPADPNIIEWKLPCTFALLIWNPARPAVHRALEIKDFEFSYVGELNWGCAKLCELTSAPSLVENGHVNITIYLRVFDDDKF